jgi:hypothetical protein
MNDDGCVGLVQAGSRVGRLDVDAVLADGMRFIIDQVFVQPISVGLLAMGGDLASAGQVTHAGADDACATDPVDVTGYGFDPVAGIAISGNNSLSAGASRGRVMMGMFRSVAQQGAWAVASDDDGGTSENGRYNRFSDIALMRVRPSGTSVPFRNDFNSLITDGFRFNCLEDDDDIFFIAGLLGGSFHIEAFLTRTSIGTIVLTPGFEVSGGIIMSHNTSESIDNDTGQLDNSANIGAFSGVGALQSCYYAFDLNGVGTTQVTVGRRGGSVYMRGDEVASPAIDGSIEVTAIGPTTVTLTQSIADPTAAQCIAILFGTRGQVAVTGLVPSLGLLGVGQ